MRNLSPPALDFIVIGAGMVGAAIAYGLARQGQRVLALDGADGDFRAARGNGGLVWVQSKGVKMPAYRELTEHSAGIWPDFARELQDVAGVDVELEQKGGLALCLGEKELEARRRRLTASRDAHLLKVEMVRRADVEKLLPGLELGRDVAGASYGTHDGSVNPLKLLLALQSALLRKGCGLETQNRVRSIRYRGNEFIVEAERAIYVASKIVLSAGIGTQILGKQIGLDVPVIPERGQAIVTERVRDFIPLPTIGVRQSKQGTIFIGTTKEDVGFDNSATGAASGSMASRAVRMFPQLARLRVVRQWGCLRIMTPDGHPIYAESESHPGAFVATCHSGLTLASYHALVLPQLLVSGQFAATLAPFHHRRFDVSQSH